MLIISIGSVPFPDFPFGSTLNMNYAKYLLLVFEAFDVESIAAGIGILLSSYS